MVLAYLLNPVMNFLERYLLRILKPRMKSEHKAKKTARGVAIFGSLAFLAAIIVLLIAAIVPSIASSIGDVVSTFPDEFNNLMDWVDEFTKGDTEIAGFIQETFTNLTATVQQFFEGDILPKIQTYLFSITSGVVYGVRFLLNVLVGVIVSVYVMASKETFAGQAKKIIYAIFKPVRANVIVETVRKSNEIFGGFISGKILDLSLIHI